MRLDEALVVPVLGRTLLAPEFVGRGLIVGRLETVGLAVVDVDGRAVAPFTVGLALFPLPVRPETPALLALGLLF